jgi:hypothetical protein
MCIFIFNNVNPQIINNFTEIGVNFRTSNVKILVFAINYNLLRIISGVGSLAYSN